MGCKGLYNLKNGLEHPKKPLFMPFLAKTASRKRSVFMFNCPNMGQWPPKTGQTGFGITISGRISPNALKGASKLSAAGPDAQPQFHGLAELAPPEIGSGGRSAATP